MPLIKKSSVPYSSVRISVLRPKQDIFSTLGKSSQTQVSDFKVEDQDVGTSQHRQAVPEDLPGNHFPVIGFGHPGTC